MGGLLCAKDCACLTHDFFNIGVAGFIFYKFAS